MILHELLGLPEREKHVVSLCGGGGKTTLMYALAREAKTLMPTALFTTTHIMTPSDADVILSVPFSKEECRAAWREGKIASSGTRLSEERKYGAPEEDTMRFLCRAADAVIIEADDRKVMELGLIENLQREDLNPIEEAEGYQVLMSQYNMTQEETAQRVGKSRSAVANALRLLNLCPPVRAMVEDGRLTNGHARALLPLSPALQETTAATILKNDLSVRQTEQLVKKLTAGKKEKPSPAGLTVDYAQEAARDLGNTLGRGCRIVSGKKKGRIELEYYGVDDLNELLEALHTIKKP